MADVSTNFNGRIPGSATFQLRDVDTGLRVTFSAPGEVFNTGLPALNYGSNRAWGVRGNKTQAVIEFSGAVVQNVKVWYRGTLSTQNSPNLGMLDDSDAFLKFLRVQSSVVEPADLLLSPVEMDNEMYREISVSDAIGIGSIVIQNNGPLDSLALIGQIQVTARTLNALATPPLPSTNCRGTDKDGDVVANFKCLKGRDDQNSKIYTCTKTREFFVSCPKLNQQCNQFSSAYVAAITVCNQKLF